MRISLVFAVVRRTLVERRPSGPGKLSARFVLATLLYASFQAA